MTTIQTKCCTKCHQTYPLNDFPRLKTTKDGHRRHCYGCYRAIRLAYDLAHREEIRRRDAAYALTHKEEARKRQKKYVMANRERKRLNDRISREKRRKEGRDYYQIHREETLARKKKYYADHRNAMKEYRIKHSEKRQAQWQAWAEKNVSHLDAYRKKTYEQRKPYIRQWAQTHVGNRVAMYQRRRAHKNNAPVNNLSHAQWLEIQAAQDHRCHYCHKRCEDKLTQDHITPLSKGGSHTVNNVVAACRSCNAKKHVGPPLGPVQPLLLTLAPAKPHTRRLS